MKGETENMERAQFREAELLLLKYAKLVGSETVSVQDLFFRVLSEDIVAAENVPHFDRSPYDGYAFRSQDTGGAKDGKTVTLKVIDNIRAGQTSKKKVESGSAVRLMTGAPLPEGADAICRYEDTDFTDETVTIKNEYSPGQNVIRAGESIKKGALLVKKGVRADAAIAGIVSSLGLTDIPVYKRPKAALISTGEEVVDIDVKPPVGMIRNSNRYSLFAALCSIGFDPFFAGHAKDDTKEIADMILSAGEKSDIIVSTGGVSAGDFDLVPDAMKEAGYEIFIKGVEIKPGMACAYGVKEGKLMLALSGNPASSLTNLQCICLPALKKIAGLSDFEHRMIKMELKNGIYKGGKGTRFIRGIFSVEDGKAFFDPPKEQGNVMMGSAAYCNAYVCVPEGRSPIEPGETAEGFLL